MPLDRSTLGLTRREFVLGAGGSLAGVWAAAGLAWDVPRQSGGSPPTIVLLNEAALRKRYPQEVAAMMLAARQFSQKHNGELVDTGNNTTPAAIKKLLVRHSRPPKRLVIYGEEDGIPRFKVKGRNLDLDTDYFYGDLNYDGQAEVAVSRVLGNPQAMIGQLNMPPPQGAPHALCFGSDPRLALELNRSAASFAAHGCTFDTQDWGDPTMLAQADVVMLAGHGDPNGWYGGITDAYVTAATVPKLPRHPVVFAGACSTVPPGSPILRAFMNQGCRVYIGAATASYGWTPGALGNELTMHMLDVMAEHPDWTVAEIIGEARNRYVRVNQLGPTLLRLERGEEFDFGLVEVSTALQFQVFGDITATYPRAPLRPLFAPHPLVHSRAALHAGQTVPIRFEIGSSDGVPILYLCGDWHKDVSTGLVLEVVQNRQLVHRLDWHEQREWYMFVDAVTGGYFDGDRYHAYAIAALFRHNGANEVDIVVKEASQPITLLPESQIQVWHKRKPVHLPPTQLARRQGINLLILSKGEGLEPLRRALTTVDSLQVDVHDDLGSYLDPFEFPGDQNQAFDLSQYDVIVIDELSRGCRRFPRGMLERLRGFVKLGGGLIMLGGRAQFGGTKEGGTFRGTPLEEALPVKMLMAHDHVFAAESTYLGRLGGYDDDAGANSPRIEDHLDWAMSQPAPVVFNNLAVKYRSQFDRQARRGDPAAQRFFADASARLASYSIDLGDSGSNLKEADRHFQWAKTQTRDRLRQAIEVKLRRLWTGSAERGWIVEGKTAVGPIKAHPIADNLDWTQFPEISGYNRVAAKPEAEVLARTGTGDPLLVAWHFGQGRSAALMASFGRTWSSELPKWPYYARFWGNLIRWMSRADEKAK